MPRPSRLTVSALVVGAVSGHVVYPAWLALAGMKRPLPTRPDPSEWPPVTVLVPAFHEAGGIAAKVDDVRANGYPGALEIMVVADGDPETAARAEQAGATVVTAPERLGKAQALNLGFSKVTTPVVVLSDANNRLARGAIAALVAHFDDPRVGAAAGEKVEADVGGEDLYWRFESWLKQREWRLGTTVGLVGELAAVRTDAWGPIPADVAIDDLWTALDLSARGFAIAYEPRARAIEPPVTTLAQQWERRTRNVAGAIHILRHSPQPLGPSGGLVTVQTWGHRLVRYTVSPLAHVTLLLVALTRLPSSRLARAFVGGHVAGAWVLWRRVAHEARGGETDGADPSARAGAERSGPPAPLAALGHALFLQGVALGGLVRYLRGDRTTKWRTVVR